VGCEPVKLAFRMSTPGRRSHYNEIAGQSLDRLAGLSDGIFAFAMTLLVLGLAVPSLTGISSENDLLNALVRLGPSVLIYTMSFLSSASSGSASRRRSASSHGPTATTHGFSSRCSPP